jgi:predicted MFS family arabinose efflux permease
MTPDSNYQADAGRERFSLAFVAASVAMASVTYGVGRYAYGLFLPEIRRDFALDTFTLGLIASVGTVVYLLSNIVASAIAIHFKPRTFIVIGGAVTTLGLALVGIATSASTAVEGILLAGAGAGIYTPAQFEAIEAWLLPPWKSRAMGAVNAGATPGKILTGLATFWVQSSWQHAWLAMAAVSFGVTVWNAWLLPKRAIRHDGMKAKQHLHFPLFTRAACIPLYGTLIVYGLLFSVYLTFAVDLVSSVGAMKSPVDKLFWPLLGIAGVTTVFTGSAVNRYGVRSLLSVSLPLCGLSYAMLALASNNPWAILGSAALFGATSIAPGTGFLVWGIRLFNERPSIGSGVVFFFLSVGTITGPILFGWMAPGLGAATCFLALTALSVVVLPFFPSSVFDTSAPSRSLNGAPESAVGRPSWTGSKSETQA